MAEVTLGLGSNLGERLATLQRAVDALIDAGIALTASSRVWETEPVGGPEGQPPYLNVVVRGSTDLSPHEVLEVSNRIERHLGRVRGVRWGPRTIDIDILLVDDLVLDDPDLTIPHPRLAERAFAVLPLLELDPDPVLPDGTRLLERRIDAGGVRPWAAPLRVQP